MGYKIKEETLEDIADAIRVKSGTTGDIQAEQFAQAILNLETGENTEEAAESARAAASSAASALSSATAAAESAGASASSAANVAVSEVAAAASKDAAAASEEAAAASKDAATASKTAAAISESNSEAWAIGTRNGIPVTSEDETYHNSAKYWALNTKEVEDFAESDIQTIWDEIFAT